MLVLCRHKWQSDEVFQSRLGGVEAAMKLLAAIVMLSLLYFLAGLKTEALVVGFILLFVLILQILPRRGKI